MKKLFVFIVFGCIMQFPLYAQFPGYVPAPNVVSPQTAEIIRYDNVPVDMYTGRISMNIPLIQLEDKDFKFPIGLSYDSGGFKPAAPDNYVGRNWTLNCGGVVYREVNGIPDDLVGKRVGPASTDGVRGFLMLNKLYKGKLSKKDVKTKIYADPYQYARRSSMSTDVSSIPNLGDGRTECSADIYNFSFGGYSGKFMMNFDGSVSCVTTSGGECTVDLTEYEIIPNTNPYTSKIKIHTDAGYTYVFGGKGYGPLEYTALSWEGSYEIQGLFNQNEGHSISAYYLTEIIAPNGRKLTIHYRDIDVKYHKNPYELTYSENLSDSDAHLQYSYSGQAYFKDNVALSYDGQTPNAPSFQRSLTKTALIDRIVADNYCIRFYYSSRDKLPQISDPGSNKFPDYCGAKLDSIAFCRDETASAEKNGRYEVARLDYDYRSGNRMFLSGISNSKRGKYTFAYNHVADNTIGPLTTNIDHGGYWRGAGTTGRILPVMRIPTDGERYQEEYLVESDDREVTGKNCDATLLNEVTYPTGGSSRFEYEPNTWSERLEIHAPGFIPKFQYPNGAKTALAGGARIKTIKYYDRGEIVKQTSYDYDYNRSSGLLNFTPVYQYLPWQSVDNRTYTNGIVRDSKGINYQPSDAGVVCYNYVGERYIDYTQTDPNAKASYKLTTFSCVSTNPDKYSVTWGQDPNAFGSFKSHVEFGSPFSYFGSNEYIHQYNANLGMKPVFNAVAMRGKILKEDYYSSDRTLLKSIEYKYSTLPVDTVFYVYSLPIFRGALTGVYSHIGTEHFYKYLLSEKKTTDYAPVRDYSGRAKSTKYKYDAKGYLISEKFIREPGDTLETVYSYSHDLMVPPDKRTYVINGTSRKLIYQGIYESYEHTRDYWKIKKVNVWNGSKLETKIEYKKYDKYGNPLHTITDGLYSTVYIWGYKGQYLIAKIENASYEEVVAVLEDDPADFSEIAMPSMYLLDDLREKLPNAHISTYSYLPFTGLSTFTDPTGHKLGYGYDTAGRLTSVWEASDKQMTNLIQVNKYNIVNQ